MGALKALPHHQTTGIQPLWRVGAADKEHSKSLDRFSIACGNGAELLTGSTARMFLRRMVRHLACFPSPARRKRKSVQSDTKVQISASSSIGFSFHVLDCASVVYVPNVQVRLVAYIS
jgi:hypothetical protein